MTGDDYQYPEPMSAEEAKARGKRNMILAAVLVAFMILIVGITITRLKGQVVRKEDWSGEAAKAGTSNEVVESGQGAPVTQGPES